MWPRISVVTPSYNQGRFIGRTIDSVLAQNYPNLEHIVVDGLSGDETPAVLARYPHLRVVREPDHGQSEAINKGFRLSTGAILGFLNSDDTLLPGALHRVAQEIDPARGRQVVMGRCIFVDEEDRATGQEHPSAYHGLTRMLQVWKGNCTPQPCTFWSREVWERCGPLDESEHLALDYDLLCRISCHYRFHWVDQVLATYRLHEGSKTCSHSAEQARAAALRISRRYWGPRWRLRYWRLLGSLALERFEQRFERRQRVARWTFRADEARQQGQRLRALAARAGVLLLAPEIPARRLFRRWLVPCLRRVRPGLRSLTLTWASPHVPAQTLFWRGFREQHPDGWVGPHYTAPLNLNPGSSRVHIEGTSPFDLGSMGPDVEVAIDGQTILGRPLPSRASFCLTVPVAAFAPGPHQLEIRSSAFVVGNDLCGSSDFRPLVFKLLGVRVS